jgi:hypothetical protein
MTALGISIPHDVSPNTIVARVTGKIEEVFSFILLFVLILLFIIKMQKYAFRAYIHILKTNGQVVSDKWSSEFDNVN